MIKKKAPFIYTFTVCLLAGVLLGQSDTTRISGESMTSRVVLTEKDFKKHNCENVGDALEIITGVYINAQGDVQLRDVSSSKVVVVMDGQKLNVPGVLESR